MVKNYWRLQEGCVCKHKTGVGLFRRPRRGPKGVDVKFACVGEEIQPESGPSEFPGISPLVNYSPEFGRRVIFSRVYEEAIEEVEGDADKACHQQCDRQCDRNHAPCIIMPTL